MEIRLAAIYIVWFDGIEILPFSIAAIDSLVDEVIIVYSNTSNHGQTVDYADQLQELGTIVNWEPDLTKVPHYNEITKRNFGLQIAKDHGHTHFVMLDCDECYDSEEFLQAKEYMGSEHAPNGLVCRLKTYIKEPTLQCNDHTLVPFIHRMRPDTRFIFGCKSYPFAYDDKGAHIDPTRRLDFMKGIFMSEATMHHFSHVRKNIKQKMENSSARESLLKSPLLEDYYNAEPGYYSAFYRDYLVEVPNSFGIHF